ncbi:MAG: universal stress protein [Gammaproteobacteria bacterium]|nr:universal stress protein [Gammaproteobacteria bacterium]
MADKGAVVFPTDFSELSLASLPWARRMADVLQGRVHCLYVVEEPQIYATLDIGTVPVPSTQELVASARTQLDRFVATHRASLPADLVSEVLVGRPSEAIIDYAREKGAAMIVMTTHGHSGIRHVLLGSTTEAVLRHAPCPVLSIRNS